MLNLKSIILGLVLVLAGSSGAFAQCGTQAPANKFCGNDTGAQALAAWKSIPAGALSAIPGGTVLANRTGALAVPGPVTNPVLGIPGTSTGEIGLAGLTSGTAILRAQAAAGSAVSLLPTSAGTLVSTASSPLAVNSTTGLLSITGLAGGVLAGAGPAFTAAPVLGVAGASQGMLGFAGLTSGAATITAQATAGTPTLTLPNASGTFAVNATTPLVLSATTGALTCPTCVTSSGGGAITGTAPIAVSAAGVVSINAPYVTLTASNGGVVYSGATNLAILAGTATARQMLQSGASTTPAWSTTTWPATSTINRILYSSAANVVGEITTANGGLLNTSSAGVPAITATPVLGVAGTTVGSIGFQNATSGTVTLQPVTGALGAVTINIPAAAGTLAVSATAPITLSAAGAIGVTGLALTKTDDTNVTLTLGGTPATSLLTATSLTLGWTGQLSIARGGTGQSSQTAAFNALAPTATVAGSILYWNGANYVKLDGNTVGTQVLTENSSGVPSWSAPGSGTVTTAGAGLTLTGGGTTLGLSTARQTQPTIQKFLSGSGTYTTPANALSIKITMTGGGGGGEGSGTTHGNGGTGGNTCWNTSGAACTTPVYQASGGGGAASTTGGTGGSTAGSGTCDMAIQGGSGSSSTGALATSAGASGGNSSLGGGGSGGAPGTGGVAGSTNTGGGGGGGSANGTAGPGAGGGAAGTCVARINAPAATYTYATGAAGTAGTAGTSGFTGGLGATSGIWVEEFYN